MIYSELVAAIMAFHNDPEITQSVPTFIMLAEAQMARKLRVRETWGEATLDMSRDKVRLPADFLSVETIQSSWGKLEYVSPQMMAERHHGPFGYHSTWFHGRRHYTIAGNEIVFNGRAPVGCPVAEVPVRMRYRSRLTPLGPANPTNWLIARNPDAYLFGALLQSCAFKADTRVNAWQGAYDTALADIIEADLFGVSDSLEMRSDVIPGHRWGRERDVFVTVAAPAVVTGPTLAVLTLSSTAFTVGT